MYNEYLYSYTFILTPNNYVQKNLEIRIWRWKHVKFNGDKILHKLFFYSFYYIAKWRSRPFLKYDNLLFDNKICVRISVIWVWERGVL